MLPQPHPRLDRLEHVGRSDTQMPHEAQGTQRLPFTSSNLGSTFQRWSLTRLISQWDRLRSKAGLETEARQKQAVRSVSYLPTSGTRSPQHPLPCVITVMAQFPQPVVQTGLI